VNFTLSGGTISLDTTSPYTTALGAASIGRFTLAAGHTYRLTGNIVQTNGTISYQWANATAGGLLGVQGAGTASFNGAFNFTDAVAYITTTVTTLVELQIPTGGTATTIGGNTSVGFVNPWANIDLVI
jgi:hypothetical protein